MLVSFKTYFEVLLGIMFIGVAAHGCLEDRLLVIRILWVLK